MDHLFDYLDKEGIENPEWYHFLNDLTAEKMNVGEEFKQLTLLK